jgi:hypothetical protein
MSTDGSANTVIAIELDMRNLLQAKRARLSDESKETGADYSGLSDIRSIGV